MGYLTPMTASHSGNKTCFFVCLICLVCLFSFVFFVITLCLKFYIHLFLYNDTIYKEYEGEIIFKIYLYVDECVKKYIWLLKGEF